MIKYNKKDVVKSCGVEEYASRSYFLPHVSPWKQTGWFGVA